MNPGWKLLVVVGLLTGCPSAEEEVPDGPAVDLGTGEIEFEALSDGDELAIVQGSQGGYHLIGSLRCKGVVAGDSRNLLEPTNPTMQFGIDHGGDSLLLTGQFTQGLDEAPESEAPWTHVMYGREARLDILFGEDDLLDGETVEFSITITDTDGTVVEDTVSLVLFPHPLNGDNAPG